MKKKVKNKATMIRLLILVFAGVAVVILGFYIYREKYFSCIKTNLIMCIQSNKYDSLTGDYTFRYRNDYPISYKSSMDMKNNYAFGEEYAEWVNFSEKFYPNAGGDRLGYVIVDTKPEFDSVKEYADFQLSEFNDQPERYKGKAPEVNFLQIGGVDAVQIIRSQQPSSFTPSSDDYIVLHSGKMYTISFNYDGYYHKKPKEYYNNAKEMILSTFSFN